MPDWPCRSRARQNGRLSVKRVKDRQMENTLSHREIKRKGCEEQGEGGEKVERCASYGFANTKALKTDAV